MKQIKHRKFVKKPGYIPVIESFGPTIQGEGIVIGQKTYFIRTAFCQYSCSWCDSKLTWSYEHENEEDINWITPQDLVKKTIDELTDGNGKLNCNHITLTGGNPAMIGDEMGEFISAMTQKGFSFSMETQGVNWQDWFLYIDDIVISPKPPSSGMKTNFFVLDKIISKLEEGEANWSLKVVIFDDSDFEFARKVFNEFRKYNYKNPFYVSVGNIDSDEQGDISQRLLQKLDWLWEKVLQDPDFNDVRPLPQLHTLVWANKRGV